MQARTMNPKAVVAAAMMMAVVAAGTASAAHLAGHPVQTRTLMNLYQGAWTSPVAVVLKSANDWTNWNRDMVNRGMAVAAEPDPANVDWSREAVLVVSLGLMPDARLSLDLASANRMGATTQVELSLANAGGSSPALVLAMDRSLAGSVQLVNGAALGLPTTVPDYTSVAPLATSGAGSGPVAVTWGELKGAYRQ